MKKILLCVIPVFVVFLIWLAAWGDFDEWRYSKNLHCENLQDSRKNEVCKSIEKYQEYNYSGHGFPTAGYRATFLTAKKTWCELNLNKADLELLNNMQYESNLAPQLQNGSGFLYNMLNYKINPTSDISKAYRGSVYDPESFDYIVKGGCI